MKFPQADVVVSGSFRGHRLDKMNLGGQGDLCLEKPSAGPTAAPGLREGADPPMTTSEKLARAAETDATFTKKGTDWVGKCLICNGPIAFDARTGEGATLEHIRARSRGGTEELNNLAVVHGRCNWEKGRRWDPKRRRRASEYEQFVTRLLERRQERWREA
jgi:hypothetical protein